MGTSRFIPTPDFRISQVEEGTDEHRAAQSDLVAENRVWGYVSGYWTRARG